MSYQILSKCDLVYNIAGGDLTGKIGNTHISASAVTGGRSGSKTKEVPWIILLGWSWGIRHGINDTFVPRHLEDFSQAGDAIGVGGKGKRLRTGLFDEFQIRIYIFGANLRDIPPTEIFQEPRSLVIDEPFIALCQFE